MGLPVQQIALGRDDDAIHPPVSLPDLRGAIRDRSGLAVFITRQHLLQGRSGRSREAAELPALHVLAEDAPHEQNGRVFWRVCL